MKSRIKPLFIFSLMVITVSCQKQTQEIRITPDDYHKAVDKMSSIMVHDIFAPPVASRIFAYTNIAAYEVMCKESSEYKTLVGQVTDLTPIPEPNKEDKINFKLASLITYYEIGKQLVFSEDRVTVYRDSLYNVWKQMDEGTFEASKNYGIKVANHIKDWISNDNYKETRTMSKFTVNSNDPSRWQPTPPDYMDGIEPHWNKIRPFVIDSASQFKPKPHPEFSLEKGTDFYKEMMEVYNVGQQMKKEGDSSEEIAIAQFWDCNPYVSTHQGHLMFATKKITPGAHWMGICKIVCKKDHANFEKTVYAYTKTSMAIADGFISAWDEKYRSNLIRPETVINQYVDENWTPLLQTPPFPEYTSAHSVISGAASEAMTSIFGDNFAFDDDTELIYGLPTRHFSSFMDASREAAISRLYGGIHYRAATQEGLVQGLNLGKFVVDKLKMTSDNTQ
ncbi:phosphatase PAP2 family protein [Yeosuana marina]|uniref:phosphatase PAP2 family protein n=1 Tax=Yeosuana marina TaxID=1565536 RepID=UPI0030EE4603